MPELRNPPVPPELRAQARQSPNTWIYVSDPAFAGQTDVPAWAVIGGYRVDEHGELSDEFVRNPNYRPAAEALGLSEPTNEVEAALRDAVTGQSDDERVRTTLLAARVFVPVNSGGGLAVVDEGLDRGVVHLFTSEQYLPDEWQHWDRLTGRQLADAVRELYVSVNPGSVLSLRLPGAHLSRPENPSQPTWPQDSPAPS
jgi:hypothetical protein